MIRSNTPLSEQTFLTFTLNRRDSIECNVLTEIQLMGINNKRVDIAKQILTLTYDPLNPTDFGLQQSFLRGQLDVLTWLIEANEVARRELLQLIHNPDQQLGD